MEPISRSDPGGGFEAESLSSPQQQTSLPPSLGETVTVIDTTSLYATGEQPAMLSNQAYSNTVQTTNVSAQNAVSNQQAMSRVRLAIVGKSVNAVANLGPLEARSSVDVLTNNELAQTILDLKAAVAAFSGGNLPFGPITPTTPAELLKLILKFLDLIKDIEKRNKALQGDGSYANPYTSTDTIYFDAPFTLGFYHLTPPQVKLVPDNNVVQASG